MNADVETASKPSSSSDLVGKYRQIFDLGRGGMADVVLAVSQGVGGFSKLQVLKLLRRELCGQPEYAEMFLEEARLSARLNHPNIAQTNEVGRDGERYFMAMEYLEGQTLEDWWRKTKPDGLPLAMVLRVLADTCSALQYAHELKDFDGTPLEVVHRDVSPHNIFVTYDGIVKLLDFGIAKASDSKTETQAGTIKGKVSYLAPEQLYGGKRVDRRADVFAIGVILWRAVSGKRLWQGVGDIEVLQRLSKRELPELVPLPDVPEKVVEICRKATAVARNERYATASELRIDLEAALAGLEGGTNAAIGAHLSEQFAERRREVARAIESRIAESTRSLSGTLPRLALSSPTAVQPESGMAPTLASATVSDTAQAMSTPPRAGGSSGRTTIAITIVALAAVAGFVVVSRSRAREAAPPPPITATNANVTASSAPGSSSTAPDTRPAADTIELTFDVTPKDASIYVDDALLHGTHGTFTRDGVQHQVRVEADGYVRKTESVPFNNASALVTVALAKAPSVATRPTTPGGRPARPAGGNSPATTPDKPPTTTTTSPATTPDKPATPDPATTRPDDHKPSQQQLDKNNPFN